MMFHIRDDQSLAGLLHLAQTGSIGNIEAGGCERLCGSKLLVAAPANDPRYFSFVACV